MYGELGRAVELAPGVRYYLAIEDMDHIAVVTLPRLSQATEATCSRDQGQKGHEPLL